MTGCSAGRVQSVAEFLEASGHETRNFLLPGVVAGVWDVVARPRKPARRKHRTVDRICHARRDLVGFRDYFAIALPVCL